MKLVTRHAALELSRRPAVMGVLNVTPDSFSDGGWFLGVEDASRRASQMIEEGAAIIDVGPESSRPGARPVEPDEQIRRAIPVIEAVRANHGSTSISVDTTSAVVAAAALEAGADIINDISALRGDPDMAALVAQARVPVVLMHMRGIPATMQDDPRYQKVATEVKDFLSERIAFASSAGIDVAKIVIDPGIGFGKTAEHNGELMRGLEEIVAQGLPVLVGASRKSFIRSFVGNAPSSVLAGSLLCVLAAAAAGVHMVRVHDIRETVALLTAAAAVIPRRRERRQDCGADEPAGVCDPP